MTKRVRTDPLQWLEGLKKKKQDNGIEKKEEEEVTEKKEVVQEKVLIEQVVQENVQFKDQKFNQITTQELEVVPVVEYRLYSSYKADFTKPLYIVQLKQRRYLAYRAVGDSFYKTALLCLKCHRQANGKFCGRCLKPT